MPSTFGLDSLNASDLAAIQTLLRTEVNASAFSILREGAAYKEAYDKLTEVNRLHLAHLVLHSEGQSAMSTLAQEKIASTSTDTGNAPAPMEAIQ
jgi:hypothetical protein